MPSMVSVMPKMVQLGVTQLKELGLTSPSRHPKATHIGNAVDTDSPTSSNQSLKLLVAFALELFDEMPQWSGASDKRSFLAVGMGGKGFEGRCHVGLLGNCGSELQWDLRAR